MLPIFDLATLESEAPRLAEACEQTGFFYLANHGVDTLPLALATEAFFAQPLETKLEIAMPKSGRAWRGYFPVGGELTSGVPDLKEGLYFGDELPGDSRPMHGANAFPRGMKTIVLGYMMEQELVGQRVLRALALGLGLPATYFAEHLTYRPTNLFRIFHYPAGNEASWGVGEHTDYGLLTLLEQDASGGLEVKTPAGWISAPPIAGALVCNLGDMLDRLTGGRFRSTPHRVRNRSGHSRYSWPFFLDPAFDARVAPLPTARVRPIDLDAAERWDRASVHTLTGTYGDYLLAKVARVFPELGKSDAV